MALVKYRGYTKNLVNKILVYKNNSILISLRAPSNPTGIIITFSYFAWSDFRDYGFSELFWLTKGYAVLSIQNKSDDWYNSLLEDDFELILKEHCSKYSKVIFYGSSMGGFAALAFRDLISVSYVIVFSPQYSVLESFDNRWSSYITEHRHSIRESRDVNGSKILVIYDPRTIDRFHANKIAQIAQNVTLLALSGATHHPGRVLNELQLLEYIQDRFIDEKDLYDIHCKYLVKKHNSPTYLSHLAWRLGARSYKCSIYSRLILIRLNNILAFDHKLDYLLAERHLDLNRYILGFGGYLVPQDEIKKLLAASTQLNCAIKIDAPSEYISTYYEYFFTINLPGTYFFDLNLNGFDSPYYHGVFVSEFGENNIGSIDIASKLVFNKGVNFTLQYIEDKFRFYFSVIEVGNFKLKLYPSKSILFIEN